MLCRFCGGLKILPTLLHTLSASQYMFLWKVTALGELCGVALSFCCVALPCLSKHLMEWLCTCMHVHIHVCTVLPPPPTILIRPLHFALERAASWVSLLWCWLPWMATHQLLNYYWTWAVTLMHRYNVDTCMCTTCVDVYYMCIHVHVYIYMYMYVYYIYWIGVLE